MTDFSLAIAEWETFYLLVGTAAATLMGLLFVAVSISNAFTLLLRVDVAEIEDVQAVGGSGIGPGTGAGESTFSPAGCAVAEERSRRLGEETHE